MGTTYFTGSEHDTKQDILRNVLKTEWRLTPSHSNPASMVISWCYRQNYGGNIDKFICNIILNFYITTKVEIDLRKFSKWSSIRGVNDNLHHILWDIVRPSFQQQCIQNPGHVVFALFKLNSMMHQRDITRYTHTIGAIGQSLNDWPYQALMQCIDTVPEMNEVSAVRQEDMLWDSRNPTLNVPHSQKTHHFMVHDFWSVNEKKYITKLVVRDTGAPDSYLMRDSLKNIGGNCLMQRVINNKQFYAVNDENDTEHLYRISEESSNYAAHNVNVLGNDLTENLNECRLSGTDELFIFCDEGKGSRLEQQHRDKVIDKFLKHNGIDKSQRNAKVTHTILGVVIGIIVCWGAMKCMKEKK